MAKRKKSATRRILWIIAALVILLIILGVVGATTGLFGGGEKATEVEVVTAETRTITQVVTASGKVQPEVEVKISPDVSGEIIELTVNEGDQVRKGGLLVRIKPDFYSAQYEQAEAGVLQAKANEASRRADMINAELELKRQQALFERKAISDSDLESATAQFDVARASFDAASYSVQSANARLREAREQLAKTYIYAPMDGTISRLNVEPGERVVGTSQMAGTEMMRIAKLDQMELEVDVNENDVVNVAIGDSARVEIDAYPERTFRGVVTEIANSARITAAGTQEQVTNFPVKVRVLDAHNIESRQVTISQSPTSAEVPPGKVEAPSFRPGMSGTVDVFTETIDGVVAVPIQAVTVRDVNKLLREKRAEMEDDSTSVDEEAIKEEDLKKVVFVVEEGKASMVEVESGISDDTHVQIKSGLDGGEKVIIGPYRAVSRTLEPEMAVKEQSEGKAPRRRAG